MGNPLAILFFLIGGWLLLRMLWLAKLGKIELISTRNAFVLGVVYFQFVAGGMAVVIGHFGRLTPTDVQHTGMIMLGLLLIFMALFNIFYTQGWGVAGLARRIFSRQPVPGTSSLIAIAYVFVIAGWIFRIGLTRVPVIGPLADFMAVGLLSAAAASAMWAWAPRLTHPVVALFAGMCLLIAIGGSLQNAFGRRDLLTVLLASVFAAFHSYWKYKGLQGALSRMAVLGFAGFVLLALFSATRGEAGKGRSLAQIISDIQTVSLSEGVGKVVNQDAGAVTMYIIDTRPDDFAYDTLHSLWYAVTQPIPRNIWPGKPNALGLDLVKQAGIRRVGEGFSYGPGLIGHIVNDNPYIAMVLYAGLFGLGLRLLDEVIKAQGLNPFVMIPVGSALGEIMAIPRGEVGLFLFRTFVMVITAWFGMLLAAKLLALIGFPVVSASGAATVAEDDEESEGVEGELSSEPQY